MIQKIPGLISPTQDAWYTEPTMTVLSLEYFDFTTQQYATVALNSPADTGTTTNTTPTLNFTGTDLNSDELEYNVQIDTVNTFDSQTPIYQQNFETGSLPLDFDANVSYGGGTAVIDSNSMISGVDSLKVSSSGSGGGGYRKLLPSPLSEAYFQFKVFIPTAFAFDTANYLSLIYIEDTSSGDIFYLNIEDTGSLGITYGGGTLGWTDTSTTLSKNVVHTIEVHIKIGTTTGILEIWLNGTQIANQVNVNTGNLNINDFIAGINYFDGSITDSIYFDDFVVSDSYIGEADLTSGPLINSISDSDLGFTAGHPFASGVAKDYTVQSALDLGTYYWRARAIDPTGVNQYGNWSSTRSFTINSGGGGITTQVNIGGVWKPVVSRHVNIGGTWKTVTSISTNIGGVWKNEA